MTESADVEQWGLYRAAKCGKESGHTTLIFAVVVAESCPQFAFFESYHGGACDESENREAIADGQARSDGPAEHFTKMGKIHGMANAAMNAESYQALLASALQFGTASKLGAGEVAAGSSI